MDRVFNSDCILESFGKLFFKKDFVYLFYTEGKVGEKERERNINVPLKHAPVGDQDCNPDMCSEWESNRRPFGLQDKLKPTEPDRPVQEAF